MQSDRFTLNQEDFKKWLRNAALFFAPAFLLFLMTVQAGGSLDEAFVAIKLWGLNTLIDITRKFIAEK